MRTIISLLSGAFLSILLFGCSNDFQLEKELEKAVSQGWHELVIPDGRYVTDKSLSIDGVKDLSIRAENPGKVIITSGMLLSLDDLKCLDAERGLYEITREEFKTDQWPDAFRGYAGWPEIYIDGQVLRLARWPNEGYIKIDSVISKGSLPARGDTLNAGGRFVSEMTASSLGKEEGPIYLGGYWCYKWYDEFIRVESVDTISNEIQLAVPHHYGIGGPSGGLFFAVNIAGQLDQPGEYYFNHETGTLRFLMPEGLSSDPRIEVAYRDFKLIELTNCSDIRFDGIRFMSNNGLALSVQDCDSVAVTKCIFTGFARSVVDIEGGSNCGLDKCELSLIGGTAVTLHGGDRQSLHPAGHYLKNSHIHHYAIHIKTYAPAAKLNGVGQYVGYNYIHDAPHNAILFLGNDHLIENNRIERVCWDTSDAGAIYCGRDWALGGTVIRNNHFKDLGKAVHHHNWAIYLDDLASGIDVIDNVIEDCPSGILVGGGRYNRVIGNKMTNCPRASIMYDARGLGWYKPYLEDPEHTLWTRLREIPVDQPPWSERFPWLQNISDDDPGIPKHVTIKDNVIINSAGPDIHPTVKKYGDVQYR